MDDVDLDSLFEDEDGALRRTRGKKTWESGGWGTVAVRYDEKRAEEAAWEPRLVLVRMKKVKGAWKRHAQVVLRGAEIGELVALTREHGITE